MERTGRWMACRTKRSSSSRTRRRNHIAVVKGVYKKTTHSTCLDSTCLNTPRRMAHTERNAKKIKVTGLGNYTCNAGQKIGSITYEFETKTFNYDYGIKLLADVMT